MNNAQLISNIKSECKRHNVTLGELLESCGLSKGFMYDVEKRDRTPSVDKVSAIAEYLNVSIDYLLGRTEEPKKINYGVENHGDNNGAINNQVNTPKTLDGISKEMLDKFEMLDFNDKVKVMSLIAELSNK